MNIDLTFAGIASIIIPFLVNVLKDKVEFIGARYAPVAAFVLGAIAGVIGQVTGILDGMTMLQAIVIGLGIGGTSTGLYSINKTSIKNG
jgi:hypothetical protein